MKHLGIYYATAHYRAVVRLCIDLKVVPQCEQS